MCVKFNLTETKEDLASLFNTSFFWEWQPTAHGLPYKPYPILTNEGVFPINWGNAITKEIHKRKSDIDSSKLLPGILPINGFYVWKKEKVIAPIGFGDHKETTKLHPLLITKNDGEISYVPVLFEQINESSIFYIIVGQASETIEQYQPNEPFVIDNYTDWLDSKKMNFKKFSDNSIVSLPQ